MTTPHCPDRCGCCAGAAGRTPAGTHNDAGLPEISVRVGTYSQFRDTMLARLSAREHPSLQRLRTREGDDFSIALVDSAAVVGDILTFYQDRLANEGYLRTATDPESVRELAAAIGYEPAPGLAAGAPLAFTVDEAAGSPRQTAVPRGTKVQSVPGPGEVPRTFETIDALDDARVEWNALRPRLTRPQRLDAGARRAYVAGIITDLKAGDGLAFLTRKRAQNPRRGAFQFCKVRDAAPDRDAGHTIVTWDRPLSEAVVRNQPVGYPLMFVFRQRAGIFGHNAPDWIPLPETMKANYLGIKDPVDLTAAERLAWPSFSIYAPKYPPEWKAPLVIPTPKSVAAAAIRAAELEAERARGVAINEVKTQLLAAVATFEQAAAEVTGLTNDAQQRINARITALLAMLTTIQDAMASLPADIGTRLNNFLTDISSMVADIEELKNHFLPDE